MRWDEFVRVGLKEHCITKQFTHRSPFGTFRSCLRKWGGGMRAEEGNEIWGIYYTVAFSLWIQSRGEQIKQKPCFTSFVCF